MSLTKPLPTLYVEPWDWPGQNYGGRVNLGSAFNAPEPITGLGVPYVPASSLTALEAENAALRALLTDCREELLNCAAMLHRDVLMRQSEKSDRAANQAREQVTAIDRVLTALTPAKET